MLVSNFDVAAVLLKSNGYEQVAHAISLSTERHKVWSGRNAGGIKIVGRILPGIFLVWALLLQFAFKLL